MKNLNIKIVYLIIKKNHKNEIINDKNFEISKVKCYTSVNLIFTLTEFPSPVNFRSNSNK